MAFRGAFSIWGRDMRVFRRSFIKELVAVVAYPITFYLAFGFGLQGYIANVDGVPYTAFIAPGIITMTAVNSAYSESGWSMWFHRTVQKTIEAYRVTPITAYDIVIAKIFSGFTQGTIKALAVAAVIFLMAPFRIAPSHLPLYLLFVFFGSMIFSCIGCICGTVIDKPENLGRVEAVALGPLIFLSGVFFPLSSYPATLLPLVKALPTTAIFDGARMALLHGKVSLTYLANLTATATAIFTAAVYIFNLRIER